MPLTQPDIIQSITNAVAVTDNAGSLTVDGTVAISGSVAVTDNAGSLTVDNGGTFAVQASQTGSWTVTANAGTGPFPVSDNAGSLTVDAPVATPVFVRLSDGASAISALPVTDNAGSLTVDNGGTFAVQAAQSGTWTVQPGNTANTTAWKVDASSVAVPVTDNSGSLTVDGTVSINLVSSSSATLSNVADAATNQTLLASNANRKGFAIYNDSTQAVYVKYGATASTTSFTFKLDPYSYYEYAGHSVYTGQIDGIWAANATGSARITEW